MDELEGAKKFWIINEQRVTVTDKKLMNNLSNSLGILKVAMAYIGLEAGYKTTIWMSWRNIRYILIRIVILPI